MNICIVLKFKSRAKIIFKLIEWLIKKDCNIELVVAKSLIKKLKIKPNLKPIIKVSTYIDKEYDFSAYKKYISKKKTKGAIFINDTFSTYMKSYILLKKILNQGIVVSKLKSNLPIMIGLSTVSNYHNIYRDSDIIGTNLFFLNRDGIKCFKSILNSNKIFSVLNAVNEFENKYYKPKYDKDKIKNQNLIYETILNNKIKKKGTLIYIGRGLVEKLSINIERYYNYGIFLFIKKIKKIII